MPAGLISLTRIAASNVIANGIFHLISEEILPHALECLVLAEMTCDLQVMVLVENAQAQC
jgi:hypothetical protein